MVSITENTDREIQRIQGEGGMVKKVLPWVIGTAGVLGATSVVNYFFAGSKPEKLQKISDYLANDIAHELINEATDKIWRMI